MKKLISIGLCFILSLLCILTSCANSKKNAESEDSDLEKCHSAIRTETTTDNYILSTYYYYDKDGSVMKIRQSAVYEDEASAKSDYAAMEVLASNFEEYSIDGLTLSCTVAESAYDSAFPERDYDSVLAAAKENGLTYEILK